ncbi:hypothetical protein CNMCM8812_007385 [Aspergillus fumigatus]|nr:hypothetical protein CNMCM8812_007385 [Aspergillus fumigatus]KAH1600659.1 hypothetical protein KXX44_004567 [Aspergillus fumigatus]KAH2979525.1 hypothetical protein KXW58_003655 [Aspergillus fumigatus]
MQYCVSFVDRATHKYQHVTLVEPSAADNFKWVRSMRVALLCPVESGDESVRRLEAATRQPITPMSFLRRDSKIRHTWIAFDCLDSPNTLLIGEFQEGDASTLILLVKYPLDYTHAGCARPA